MRVPINKLKRFRWTDSLSPELTARVKALYPRITGLLTMPFEQFENGFLYDLHPEREIAIWEVYAATVERLVAEAAAPVDEGNRKKLFAKVIEIASGALTPEQILESDLHVWVYNTWTDERERIGVPEVPEYTQEQVKEIYERRKAEMEQQ